MKLKKVLALALTVGAMVTITACGTKSDNATSNNQMTQESAEVAQENTEVAPVVATNQTIEATDPSKLPAVAANRSGTFIVGLSDFAGVFNMFYAESTEDQTVGGLTTASFGTSNEKGEVVDGTANISVSEDGTVYTFKIKDTDKFNDGTKTKAADYLRYYEIIAAPSYDGPGDLSKYGIVGYSAYNKGEVDSIEGIKVVDDSTLEITLEAPNTSAIYSLSSAFPVHEMYADLIKPEDLSGFKNLSMIDAVWNGAYVLKEYKEKESATLKSNPNFYLGEAKIKDMILKVVAVDGELDSLIAGTVDYVDNITTNQDNIDLATAEGFINIHIQPTLGYGYVGMNHNNPIFADPKVRQALLYAVNRKDLAASVYGPYAEVLNIPQAKVSWLYDEDGINAYDYDLEKAAQLFEEAGYVKEGDKLMKDGKQLSILFTAMSGNPVTDTLIPLMIDAYGQLGIDFKAEYVDWPTLTSKQREGKFEMFFMAWGLTADPDISNVYASKEAGGSQNHLGYSNKELDAKFKEALGAPNEEKEKEVYKEIYKIINEDLPIFPIYQRTDCKIYNTRVKNFKASPYVRWYYQDVIVDLEIE